MEKAEDADPEDARAVGPEPILHDGRLFALHPGQEPAEVQHHEHGESHGNGLEQEIEGEIAHPFTMAPASPIAR